MVNTRTKRRRIGYRVTFVVILVLILVGFRLVEEIGRDRGPSDRFRVGRVIDGDTMDLQGGDRLRLVGIDTPEEGEAYYDRARIVLDSLCGDDLLRLEYQNTRRDRYGRLLAWAYVDTTFVNAFLVRAGLAYVYLFSDQDMSSPEMTALLEAQRQAIDRRVGIWSMEVSPEDYYVTPPGSFRFHRPGCRSVASSDPGRLRRWDDRLKAARNGLSPCRNCRP